MYTKENLNKLPVLARHAPEAMKAFRAWDKVALADGAIPKKYKELIAVAVALTTQCPYCIDIHRQEAIKAGVTEQQLAEVVWVAAALRAGGAIPHGTHLSKNFPRVGRIALSCLVVIVKAGPRARLSLGDTCRNFWFLVICPTTSIRPP